MATIKLNSSSLRFESANVTVLLKSAPPESMRVVGAGELRDGMVLNIPVPDSGQVVVHCRNCWVQVIATGHRRFIPAFEASGDINAAEHTSGTIELNLDQRTLVRIVVVDRAGRPIGHSAMVGVACPGVTLEQQTDDDGALSVLLAPTPCDVYLVDNPRSVAAVALTAPGTSEKTVELREP